MKILSADERYQRTIDTYINYLQTRGDISLQLHCVNEHTSYDGISKWMKKNNLSVKSIKAELHRTGSFFDGSISTQNFIQIKPPTKPALDRTHTAPCDILSDVDSLSGVSFTFKDGTTMRVESADAKSIASLAVMYQKAIGICLD